MWDAPLDFSIEFEVEIFQWISHRIHLIWDLKWNLCLMKSLKVFKYLHIKMSSLKWDFHFVHFLITVILLPQGVFIGDETNAHNDVEPSVYISFFVRVIDSKSFRESTHQIPSILCMWVKWKMQQYQHSTLSGVPLIMMSFHHHFALWHSCKSIFI